MEKLIKIAEIITYSEKSADEVAEALENAGFAVVFEQGDEYKRSIEVIKKIQ